MSVSLSKGGKVSLSKEAASLGIKLSNVAVGLGWDCNENGGDSFDLDAWAAIVSNGELKKKNLVYFGNKLDSSKTIRHMGDNLTGEGEGDDETITMNLQGMPTEYTHILIGVTIYMGQRKGQTFKDVNNTYIRIYDSTTNKEICIYKDEFKKEFANSTTVLFGILVRVGDQWEFNAVGRGEKSGSIASVLNVFSDYQYLLTDNNTSTTPRNGGNKVMAVSLSKGGKVSLAKVAADAGISKLSKILVGLGWDTNRYDGGADFDLDASCFLLGANGKVRNESDFIFYNNLTGPGVQHMGDERTGGAEGDDEQIKINLDDIPADVEKIAFSVTIDKADERNQNFGMVENSFIRIVDEETNTELLRYDLGEDFSVENTIVVAELYRHNGEWKFNAIGSGFSGGLAAICGNYGVDVG